MGAESTKLNQQTDGSETGTGSPGPGETIIEHLTDTNASTGPGQGTGTSPAAEKRKHGRKNREIPILVTPAENISAPDTSPEKAPRKRTVKADPIITAAIIAIAGSGMMTAGKMLNEEKLWTPSTAELTSVAEPAARIIERLNATATVSKYADYIALGVAVATIIIPRLMATSAKKGRTKPHAAKKGTSPYPAAVHSNTEAAPVPNTGEPAREEIPEINPSNVQADSLISQADIGYDESF